MKKIVNNNIIEVEEPEMGPTNMPVASTRLCNGNACSLLNVGSVPTGEGMRFTNKSNKPIHVSIEFITGLRCASKTVFTINPHSFKDYGNGGYCNAMQANG
jgi:hypothetical protein